jgi:hypothetical protein
VAQPLPREVGDLWFALEEAGYVLPPYALAVKAVVWRALESRNPRGVLNLEFRRLRDRYGVLVRLGNWLMTPAVRSAVASHGAHWTLTPWCNAIIEMLMRRATAHEAFKMNAGGRRHQPAFSMHEDLALYIAYRHENGEPKSAIEADLSRVLKGRLPQARALRSSEQQVRQAFYVGRKLRAGGLEDLRCAADVARSRWRLP